MILPFLLGFLLLWTVTAVHEAGHALAIQLKGGTVVATRIGRGPGVRRRLPGGGVLALGLLPVGGGIHYHGVPSGTGTAAVALAGPAANLLLAAILLPTDAVARWLWLVPGAVAEMIVEGRALALLGGTRTLAHALVTGDPSDWMRALGALSAIWASLNLLPLPALRLPALRSLGGDEDAAGPRGVLRGTDGWEILRGLGLSLLRLVRPPGKGDQR